LDEQRIDSIAGETLRKLQQQRTSTAANWKRWDDAPLRRPSLERGLAGAATAASSGVFPDILAAFAAAQQAFEAYQSTSLETRHEIINAVRQKLRDHVEEISTLAVEETGLGRAPDKIKKNLLVINKSPGPEILRPEAWSGDHGLMITEPAPYGVIGSITPSTNPSETVINNGIGMLAAGNAIVFNPHPSAARVTTRTLSLINEAIQEAGGPANLLTTCATPNIETAQELMRTRGIRLLVVTGGSAVVQAAFASGKKVIAAGPGNPPAVVDDSADLHKAARDIVASASLDNNIICTSEKETLCVASVIDPLIELMGKEGCYVLSAAQAAELKKHVLVEDRGPRRRSVVDRNLIGRNARVLLEKIGVHVGDTVRLAIYKADPDDTMVWTEQLMPFYPVAPVDSCEQAIDLAIEVEHGYRHTATMWSRNIDMLSEMARRINASIFVKNGPSYAGLGFGGEGYTSFTIASPTGEGMTNARHFSRYRRCTLVDHFRIV
jgi:acyl-CoA reductase-like NAD-dependent aldehyde dehydrogenase